MLTGPIPATERLLARNGWTIDDVDVVEINEAFASVVLAWMQATGADPAKVNPNGGAIALGHPLGGTGAILLTKAMHELERVRRQQRAGHHVLRWRPGHRHAGRAPLSTQVAALEWGTDRRRHRWVTRSLLDVAISTSTLTPEA